MNIAVSFMTYPDDLERQAMDIAVSFKTYPDDPERPGMDIAVSSVTYLVTYLDHHEKTSDGHSC